MSAILPLIQQALFYGYNAMQVIGMLQSKFPHLKKPISGSLSSGFTPESVLEFLSKGQGAKLFKAKDEKKAEKDNEEFNSSYDKYLENIGMSPKEKRQGKIGNVFGDTIKDIPKYATMALSAYNAYKFGKPLLQAMMGQANAANLGNGPLSPGGGGPQAPNNNPMTIGGISPQQGQGNNPAAPTGMPPTPSPLGSQQAPSQPTLPSPGTPPTPPPPSSPKSTGQNQTQPQAPQSPPTANNANRSDVLWEALSKGVTKGADPETDAFLKVAKQIKSTGGLNTKEEFDKFHQNFEQKRHLGMSVPELAKEMFATYDHMFGPNAQQPQTNATQNEANAQPNQPIGEEITPESLENAPNKSENPEIEKNNLGKEPEVKKPQFAKLPDGTIAEIKSEKGKVYRVDQAGKERLIPKKKAELEPPSVSNSQVTFDLDKVPESDRSAQLSFVEMPKSRKDAIIKFGLTEAPYRYWRKDGQPIDEDIANRLREGVTVPITDGDEFMGAWNSEEATSRGTVSSKEFIQGSQEEGTEDDPSKPYWFEKLESVFIHGYFKQFYDELGVKKENFDRSKAQRKLNEGTRKKARKEKDIKRRYE
jgi:hypothetical protein